MKVLFPGIAILMCNLLYAEQTYLCGKISNRNNLNEEVFKVVAIRNLQRVDSTYSNTAGFYKLNSQHGFCELEFSKPNHYPVRIKNIYLRNVYNSINFSVNFIRIPLSAQNPATQTYNAKDSGKHIALIDSFGKGKFSDLSFLSPASVGSSHVTAGAYSIKTVSTGSTAKSYAWSFGDREVKSADKKSGSSTVKPRSDKKLSPAMSYSEETLTAEKTTDKTLPGAGNITAGHWRDLDHWNEWLKTNMKEEIKQHQKTWDMYPGKLMKIKLLDKKNKPLTYTAVTLCDQSHNALWEGYSDEKGHVYFWPGVYKEKSTAAFYLKIAGKNYGNIDKYINSETAFKTDLTNERNSLIEIGFVVDATGSMGDEIRYLQSELMDVINRVKKNNQCAEIMTGSVFYRDRGDEYLTRVLPLSSNPANTIEFIGNQSAGGGGDFPEAVDDAVEACVNQLGWSEGRAARIMFLLLDAPPHRDSSNIAKIKSYTRMAAARGIRIIPIAASGIDKPTEFLLKYMSIISNGEYLYITDDSKIGNSHLKPTGGESKVEYLNDLMVKIINQYCEPDKCPEQNLQRDTQFEDSSSNPEHNKDSLNQRQNQNIVAGNDWFMHYYPNPAVNTVHVVFSDAVNSLKITDLNGRTLHEINAIKETEIDISNWSTGIYIIYAVKNNETISGKLLIMH